ncbi:hypothetical protein B0H13DRAFT_1597788, partial [Mycena leptocephala]
SAQVFAPPSQGSLVQMANYTSFSNSTLKGDKPTCKGKAFNRIIQIWLENTDFASLTVSTPIFKPLAEQDILLTNYNAVMHPSEPNYIAAIGGDFFGMHDDNMYNIPSNISTVVDLLEDKHVSWATHQENMPADEFYGFKQRRTRHNDAHDTTIDFAAAFLEYWLLPLLTDPHVNDDETLILLAIDETETYTIQNNVFAVVLGGSIPLKLRGTTDDTMYTHYPKLSTVQANWGLKSLGRQDTNAYVVFFVFLFIIISCSVFFCGLFSFVLCTTDPSSLFRGRGGFGDWNIWARAFEDTPYPRATSPSSFPIGDSKLGARTRKVSWRCVTFEDALYPLSHTPVRFRSRTSHRGQCDIKVVLF